MFVSEHIDVVLERIGANTEATTQNGTHRRLIEACDALGYEHRPIWRNAALDDDPANCGYCPAGCQQGCKRSAMKTWLQDCSDAGGRAVVGAHADRILTDDGRATGVEATVTHEDGTTTALRVDAPTVVVACGSVESPALLLRSGIGGPAVGKNLRLHPAYVVMGVYDEPVEGWRGQIQSALSDHFFDVEDGFGFLIEATGVFPALLGASFPWESGEDSKRIMQSLRWQAPFITVARDHGSGEVVLDEHGRAVVRWELDDEVDARLAPARERRARAPSRGRRRDRDLHRPRARGPLAARRGLRRVPRPGRRRELRARTTSPASPRTRWAPAGWARTPTPRSPTATASFTTSRASGSATRARSRPRPGVNPMVTIMALAHRTAGKLLAAGT